MHKWLALLLLLICSSSVVYAQEQAPTLLREVAHCLAIKNDLLDISDTKTTALSLGFLVDTKSYPRERVLYVVSYTGPGRSEGFVFTVFLQQHDQSLIFNIQNNAKFVRSKGGIEGVDFVEPPLGGTWTQEHLVRAIKRIEGQPKFSVQVKDLQAPFPTTECESYADSK
jgi:hypothetical protein